jgi:hypothetical protein
MSDRVVDISNDDADVNVDQELADTAIKLKQVPGF